MERNVVGEAGDRAREKEVAERRGPVQCRAGTDTQSSAFRTLPWKPHSSPACIPTDCSVSFLLSLYLSFFSSMLFISLLICVSVSLDFCHFYMHRAHTHPWRRAFSRHVGFNAVHSVSRWMGNRTVYFAFQCTWTRKHLAVFAASLYFYSPFCSAPCFSNAPSSHCICPHTGHLSIISPEFWVLSWTYSPFFIFHYLRGNVHILVLHIYAKVWILLSCSASSFPLILLCMYASLLLSLSRSLSLFLSLFHQLKVLYLGFLVEQLFSTTEAY